MNQNLILEFVRLSESAALASSLFTGRGDPHGADQAAVDAMRKAFESINIQGTVVIGEGERDQAPMLYIGEKVGSQGPDSVPVDIALDPLEGTQLCAHGLPGALSVVAATNKGHLLHAPDTYMNKIAVGPEARGQVSLEAPCEQNIQAVAQSIGKKVQEVNIAVLNRPRNQDLVNRIRKLGARILWLSDGDVAPGIATSRRDLGVDMLLGIGAAPEGVLTAVALKCLGGEFMGQMHWQNPEEKKRAQSMGVQDLDRIYGRDDLAQGEVLFCATGVTSGLLLNGVRDLGHGKFYTQSLVMDSKTRTLRFIESEHDMGKKPKDFSGGL